MFVEAYRCAEDGGEYIEYERLVTEALIQVQITEGRLEDNP
jgi:hypothetical protein